MSTAQLPCADTEREVTRAAVAPSRRNAAAGTQSARAEQWVAASGLAQPLDMALQAGLDQRMRPFARRRLAAGTCLCRAGAGASALYLVESGFLKTSLIRGDTEEVLAFPMPGDVVGVEAFERGAHEADCVALDASEVVVIPYACIGSRGDPQQWRLAQALFRLFSRALARRSELALLRGGRAGAEARLAAFLVFLSQRYAQLGCSPQSFTLRMSRADIGAYLGLATETVSRAFAALCAAGLISTRWRTVEIRNARALAAFAECEAAVPAC